MTSSSHALGEGCKVLDGAFLMTDWMASSRTLRGPSIVGLEDLKPKGKARLSPASIRTNQCVVAEEVLCQPRDRKWSFGQGSRF